MIRPDAAGPMIRFAGTVRADKAPSSSTVTTPTPPTSPDSPRSATQRSTSTAATTGHQPPTYQRS